MTTPLSIKIIKRLPSDGVYTNMLTEKLRGDRNAEAAKAGGLVSRSSPGNQHRNAACGIQTASRAKRPLTLTSQLKWATNQKYTLKTRQFTVFSDHNFRGEAESFCEGC